MRRLITLYAVLAAVVSCGSVGWFDPESVPDAPDGTITRIEPPCWWTGMTTSLQLMVNGPQVSSYSKVTLEGLAGVRVKKVHAADSPNYLFVDVDIADSAESGSGFLVFENSTGDRFKVPYGIGVKSDVHRESFSTADMIYLVFPDRFANGDPGNDTMPQMQEPADRSVNLGRHGGDIKGIIDHLDYIAGLGATAIWCTPLLTDDQESESYHGYACGDYYNIDPRMGTNDLYREFVRKAHDNGLKVIMDIVTNHCGTAHWWMKDLPFKDWVHVFPEYTGTNIAFSTNMDPNASKYDLNLQESGWFVPSMPDMNLDNPFVLKYFQQWAVWWIEYAGLDGLRVDTYPYNEKEPMSRWCASVSAEYPWINIVGECWTMSYPQLAYWQKGSSNEDGFDSNLPSIMDFPLYEALTAAICEGGDNPEWGHGMTRVYDCLSHDFVYADLSRMMTFFANHDHGRMGDTFDHDPAKMKIALALLATIRGIPQLYSGDEMMFSHVPGNDWSDGAKRIDFPGGWAGDSYDLFTAEGRKAATRRNAGKSYPDGTYTHAEELHDYTARLFGWRKGAKAVHEGKTLHFMTRDNTYAFFRYTDTDAVFVYVNNSDSDKSVPWNHYREMASGDVHARNVITGEAVVLAEGLSVPAKTVLVAEFKR